jgi:hypothetical protein
VHKKISFYLCLAQNIVLDSLGYERSAQQNIGGFVANVRSVHLNSFNSEKNISCEHTREITKLKKNLKVTEYLGEGIVQRRNKETKLLKTL